MTLTAIFLLAVALAMDAFAVSIATGIQLRMVTVSHTLRMSAAFGGFQFLMPVLGWFAGIEAQRYIESFDHWAAFALLAFVGCKMLKEAWENKDETDNACAPPDPTRASSLLLLGIATSLDALAVGLSMALLDISVWAPALVIGVVCFCFTALGMQIGRFACRLPALAGLGSKANALGGIVLLGIGLSILYEHGVFS